MLGTIWSDYDLKHYHDDMLLVRVRPSVVDLSDRLKRPTPAIRRQAPGLAALQGYLGPGRRRRVRMSRLRWHSFSRSGALLPPNKFESG